MFLYISSAPYIVVSMLHMGEQDFWVLFVPMIGGMIAGSWASGRLAGRFSGRRIASVGYAISLLGAGLNLVLALFTTGMPWAVLALPVLSFGIAMAFPARARVLALEPRPGLAGDGRDGPAAVAEPPAAHHPRAPGDPRRGSLRAHRGHVGTGPPVRREPGCAGRLKALPFRA
jgi:hypothetical protein